MITDDSNRNHSISVNKWPTPVHGKISSSKHINKSCRENLGEFIFNAQCSSDINPTSDDCCNNTSKECVNLNQSCEGRILILHVNLKNICPNKMIVVSVLVFENNRLYASKVKKMTTDSFDDCKCRDFDAGKFCFILQENHLCHGRKLKAKVISHYTKF